MELELKLEDFRFILVFEFWKLKIENQIEFYIRFTNQTDLNWKSKKSNQNTKFNLI